MLRPLNSHVGRCFPGEVEKARIREEHPGDHEAIVNCGGDDGSENDLRVKGVCAFTRSLGDFQLKDAAAATVYNSYTQVRRESI